jgi:hypothetical protein
MKSIFRSCPSLSSLAFVLIGALGGCSSVDPSGHNGFDCSTVGCVNAATFDLRVEGSAEWLRGAVVEVCRNDRCARAEIPTDSAGRGAVLTGAFRGNVFLSSDADGYRLQVNAEAENERSLANGDRYTFRLIDTSVASIIEVERTATYTETYPNGKDCDPIPCRDVRFDLGKIRIGT